MIKISWCSKLLSVLFYVYCYVILEIQNESVLSNANLLWSPHIVDDDNIYTYIVDDIFTPVSKKYTGEVL